MKMPKSFGCVLCLFAWAGCAEKPIRQSYAYRENEAVFRNPGQGWSAAYEPVSAFDGIVNIGAVYDRWEWRDLEPEEGRYDWARLDARIEYARTNGVPYYFRIMCVNACSNRRRESPDWFFAKPGAKKHVWQKGNKYRDWTNGGKETTEREAPYFDDPVFLQCHGRFIAALAKRYDGHPVIGAIDIGSYGNFAEWHCFPMEYPYKFDAACRRAIADMYLDNFTKTPLLFLSGENKGTFAYAVSKGTFPRVGVRLDSVGSTWHYGRWVGTPPYKDVPRFGEIWKSQLVFLEFIGGESWFHLHEKNEWYRGKQSTIPEAVDWILAQHASLVNTCPITPKNVKKVNPAAYAAFRKIDLYAGARLVPRTAESVLDGETLRLRLDGKNKGTAPILLPYRLEWRFRDSDGKLLGAIPSETDVRTLLPGVFRMDETLDVRAFKGFATVSLAVAHIPAALPDFRLAAQDLNRFGELVVFWRK